jgi:hypothetical protein
MSGRSGYRKTDRKRHRRSVPAERADYVLRFKLPSVLAFAIAPGEHGWGVTVGFHDLAVTHGQNPAHCCQLAADFLDKIGARRLPQKIEGSVVKLLPCSAHAPAFRGEGFRPLGHDLEAVHDNISRNAKNWRACTIDVGADTIIFTGITPKPLVHEFSDS